MIKKLKQIEDKIILNLLDDTKIWNSETCKQKNLITEKIWTIIGNYKVELSFIHLLTENEYRNFKKNNSSVAIHILHGKCKFFLGFSPDEEPPIMCTLLLENGGAYYDMTHIDGWHYVRPVEGVCATVMLAGKPWGREEIESPEKLEPLNEGRKLMMLEWFSNFYKAKYQVQKLSKNQGIKKGDWVELDKNLSDSDKRGLEQFIGKMGFVIKNENGMIDVRFGNDRTQIHSWKLKMLDPNIKPSEEQLKQVKAEKKELPRNKPGEKIDDMDPKNWKDDDEDDNDFEGIHQF